MEELRFDGRVAVITGGGRGLGREYALLLGSRGCKVVVNDNGSAILGEGTDAGPAQAVVDEIKAAGGEAVATTASVATPEGGREIVQTAIDAFGRVDILIHNAGNVRYGSLLELSQEDFEAVIDVHLKGAFHVVRAAFPHMHAQKYGRVVLTSSIGGIYGNQRVVNYGMSKAGMLGLSNIIALEGEEFGIKSNLILPTAETRMAEGLDTSMYPPLGPELVAPAVAWMCHESCTISGEMLMVGGGRINRAFVSETVGVWQPDWTIEQVGERIEEARAKEGMFDFGFHGYMQHLGTTFAMAKQGRGLA